MSSSVAPLRRIRSEDEENPTFLPIFMPVCVCDDDAK